MCLFEFMYIAFTTYDVGPFNKLDTMVYASMHQQTICSHLFKQFTMHGELGRSGHNLYFKACFVFIQFCIIKGSRRRKSILCKGTSCLYSRYAQFSIFSIFKWGNIVIGIKIPCELKILKKSCKSFMILYDFCLL